MCLIEDLDITLVLLEILLEVFNCEKGIIRLRLSSVVSDQLFEIRSACVETSPVMSHVIAIVREKVAIVSGPLEFLLLLLFLNGVKITVHCAIEKIEFSSIRMIHKYFCRILKKGIVNMGILPGKIHSSGDHNLISLIMSSIIVEASKEYCWVAFYLLKFVVEFLLNINFYCLTSPLVHSARSTIKFMHHMSKDTVVALDLALCTFKHRLPNKF
jgi:hypothetical protein